MVKGQLEIKVNIVEKSRKNKREKTKQMKWMSKQFVCEHSIRNLGFYGWSWTALKRTDGDDLLDLIESKNIQEGINLIAWELTVVTYLN